MVVKFFLLLIVFLIMFCIVYLDWKKDVFVNWINWIEILFFVMMFLIIGLTLF